MENNHDLNVSFENDLVNFVEKYIDAVDDLKQPHKMVFIGIAGLAMMIENVSEEEAAEITEMAMDADEDRFAELHDKVREVAKRMTDYLDSSN